MATPTIEVLAERVGNVAAEIVQLREDNQQEHKEFRQMANRLPPWGTAIVTLLSLLLGSAITRALSK